MADDLSFRYRDGNVPIERLEEALRGVNRWRISSNPSLDGPAMQQLVIEDFTAGVRVFIQHFRADDPWFLLSWHASHEHRALADAVLAALRLQDEILVSGESAGGGVSGDV